MPEKEKTYMPQSTAGLIRYFDEETSIKLKPEHIIWLSVGVIGVVILMNTFA